MTNDIVTAAIERAASMAQDGWTFSAIGRAIGVTDTTVGRIARRLSKPTPETAAKILACTDEQLAQQGRRRKKQSPSEGPLTNKPWGEARAVIVALHRAGNSVDEIAARVQLPAERVRHALQQPRLPARSRRRLASQIGAVA